MFLLRYDCTPRHPRSFPTRRSSDLTVYRDPTGEAPLRRAAGQRGTVAEVLRSRDLWLVASATLVFAAMQTVWMAFLARSEEHTSELQSRLHLVCRLLLEKKNRRCYA